MFLEVTFFLSLAIVLYALAGYPAVMLIFAWFAGRPWRRAAITPSISVIIAAHNEERAIARKIENTLGLDYPPQRLQVIVASDGSSDRTDEIASSFAEKGVLLSSAGERRGKTLTQRRAVGLSTGDLLVFSDATTIYRRDALRRIARNFADPEVGCVSGKLTYGVEGGAGTQKGCSGYWRYEEWLKDAESRAGSLIGVTGCFYALRRSCFARFPYDLPDDFVIAAEMHLRGLRSVFDSEAVCHEVANACGREEMRMRVRVIEQSLRALHRYRDLLNPFRHGMFAFQMLSHKVLRYSVWFWLLAAFLTNALLVVRSPWYAAGAAVQAIGYLAAILGYMLERTGHPAGPFAYPYYFVLTHLASMKAAMSFLRGKAHLVWTPERGSRAEEGKIYPVENS